MSEMSSTDTAVASPRELAWRLARGMAVVAFWAAVYLLISRGCDSAALPATLASILPECPAGTEEDSFYPHSSLGAESASRTCSAPGKKLVTVIRVTQFPTEEDAQVAVAQARTWGLPSHRPLGLSVGQYDVIVRRTDQSSPFDCTDRTPTYEDGYGSCHVTDRIDVRRGSLLLSVHTEAEGYIDSVPPNPCGPPPHRLWLGDASPKEIRDQQSDETAWLACAVGDFERATEAVARSEVHGDAQWGRNEELMAAMLEKTTP